MAPFMMSDGGDEIRGATDCMTTSILLIGFGNTLRRDDGLGCLIAGAVDRLAYPGVRTIAEAQLTPDLAEVVAASRLAVFVDARRIGPSDRLIVEPLEPARASYGSLDHAIGPRFVLGLCRVLFGRCPPSRLISVPAADFSFGDDLSPVAVRGMRQALDAIDELIARVSSPEPQPLAPCPTVELPSFSPTRSGPRP
jgi:hydrogenase maturation protease